MCCIPLNCVGLCSSVQLESGRSSWGLLLSSELRARGAFFSRGNSASFLRWSPSEDSSQCCMYCKIFQTGWWEHELFPALCESWLLLFFYIHFFDVWLLFYIHFFDVSFPPLDSFLSCIHKSVLSQRESYTRLLSRFLEFSLYSFLFSGTFVSQILAALASSKLNFYLLDSDCWAVFGPSLSVLWLRNFSGQLVVAIVNIAFFVLFCFFPWGSQTCAICCPMSQKYCLPYCYLVS